jgi:hypothetical protein
MQIGESLKNFAPLTGESYLLNDGPSVESQISSATKFNTLGRSSSSATASKSQASGEKFSIFMDKEGKESAKVTADQRIARRKSKRISLANISFRQLSSSNILANLSQESSNNENSDAGSSLSTKDKMKKRFSFRKTPSQMKLMSSPSSKENRNPTKL